MDKKTPAIGIDLGTTNSCVGVYESSSGKVEIIINDLGLKTTPSYVSFTDNDVLIGHNAKEKARRYLRSTIFDVKRLIGREFDDPVVVKDIEQWPFEVTNDDNKPKIRVEVNGVPKTYAPEEISAMVLRKMKETAEAYLGKSVTNAVITVPAYFNDSQRQATKDAATIAGLNVLRLLNEPTAAAIAYGIDKKCTKRNVLIFDLGGGTFDVSILTLRKVTNETLEVKSIAGNSHLGGEDFDNNMVQHFVREFKRVCDKDLNQKALRTLKTECEIAKRVLSSAKEAPIDVESFHDGTEDFKITRACFEEVNDKLFQSTLALVKKAIKDAKMDKSQIDDVVLVGGSSRIPKVQKLLEDFFGNEKINKTINPDEAVAYGAAIQAAILNGDQSKQTEKLLLVDVTPLSLGIQDSDDEMNVVIERNTTIPAQRRIAWTTSYKNQTEVIISVYEGESRKASENHMIGQFTLGGIRNSLRTMVDIEIIMDLDANGILKVSATEKSASKRNSISITCQNGRLSKKEIQRMIEKAQEDKTTVDNEATRISAKHSLESCLFEITNIVKNEKQRHKISKTEKKIILDKCTETLRWIDSNSSAKTEEFRLKLKELEDVRVVITAMNVSNAFDPNERYYKVLNVKKGESKTVIEDNFRSLASKYHPDKFHGDKRIANFLFKTISDAKDSLLIDAKRRRLN